jgi:hypothetical protein
MESKNTFSGRETTGSDVCGVGVLVGIGVAVDVGMAEGEGLGV